MLTNSPAGTQGRRGRLRAGLRRGGQQDRQAVCREDPMAEEELRAGNPERREGGRGAGGRADWNFISGIRTESLEGSSRPTDQAQPLPHGTVLMRIVLICTFITGAA